MSKLWSRREWMRGVGGVSGAALFGARRRRNGRSFVPQVTSPGGPILPLVSTSEVFVPPRGRSYMKFSFDFPEPSVELDGIRFGFLVFSYENAYGLDASAMRVASEDDGLHLICDGFVWAGGQESAAGRFETRLRKEGDFIEWSSEAEMEEPVKAVSTVLRGVPRGRISCAGQRFFDPGDDEVLLGYPFSGGDLFGPGSARGMPTPFAVIESGERQYFFLSSLDTQVRTKRFYFQPGETAYRVEAVHETEGWKKSSRVSVPSWRIGKVSSMAEAAAPHFEHIERTYRIPRWETREDASDWLREVALVITLHGMHFTGYVFNDYARMLEILRWVATRIPAGRVVAFVSSWDGRYYWDYPLYSPAERMGGDSGFRRLVRGGQELGFRMMPMFGANAANRMHPMFREIADGHTEKVDGDRFDLNWVDWDNDRHQDGWLSYMNLGVESWRHHLTERIAEVIERYRPDAYFLDIVGGWVNNPKADMHEGTRRLVEELRARYPDVVAVGEMHYDALLSFIPIYHSFSQTEVASELAKYTRFFQHLSYPAPGRGSTGVHEAGFRRSTEDTFSLSEPQIPTLNVVDDTFDARREDMKAVILHARERAGL
ncbi:MAG TPA: hypothetical protein VLK65_31200 [Vicinamibacteria bacterium]|nr:hypothetical protein [Vicinamibacteria bacterium]